MRRCIKNTLLTFIMLFTLISLCCVCAYAINNVTTYEVEELAMTVDIPTNIKVVTRGVKQSDPLFQDGVYDYVGTMANFRDNNIYLTGKDETSGIEINVTMTEDATSKNYKNFKMLSSGEKNSVLESIVNQDMVVACSIYETDSATFFESVLRYSENDINYYIKQYYTVSNGQNINISLLSSGGKLTTQENKIISDIVDSIVFEQVKGQSGSSIWGIIALIAVVVLAAGIFIYIYVFKFSNKIDDNEESLNYEENKDSVSYVNDEKEDIENAEQMMAFLATDAELEQKNNSSIVTVNPSELDESTDNEEKIVDVDLTSIDGEDEHSIDIACDIDSPEAADDEDEEIDPNLFIDDNMFFTELDEETSDSLSEHNDDTLVKDEETAVENTITSETGSKELKEELLQKNHTIADELENETNKEADAKSIDTESNSEAVYDEPVDLDAAIAYFQDDFETRKERREERKAKNKKKKLFFK